MHFRTYIAKQLGDSLVSEKKFEQLELYVNELLRWNKKINLTAIVDIENCWEKHIYDSLLLVSSLNDCGSFLDIGSGAGLPSIPLKIILPNLHVLSIDSVEKKINFQRHMVRLLGFTYYMAKAARIESLENQYSGQFDVVTSRAFASLKLFIQHALPFVKREGVILAMKGALVEDEIVEAEDCLVKNDLYISKRISCFLPISGAKREILQIRFK